MMPITANIPSAISLSLAFLLLTSCMKEELPVPRHEPGNVKTATVNMESNYKWQIFYSLKKNTIVSQNLKTAWDIAFETSPQGYRIILNTSKAMFAAMTSHTELNTINDTAGFSSNKRWDAPSGNLDSTAIGNWKTHNHVYIIDRGINEMGIHLGFVKLKVESVNAEKYVIRFAFLNQPTEHIKEIFKDSSCNFSYFSFDESGKQLIIEPHKNDWDILFTQYIHVFYNPTIPYLVTGCLTNRARISTARDESNPFEKITYQNISQYSFSSDINVIGYNWKTYTSGTYITDQKKNYIIKTSEGIFYKLRFIDFLNSAGIKGNPMWEYQEL
ncbi:MAG: hypothetical protein NZ529_02840 [Cytophagaceae bacterium]|nr:hypothetical protein [Cytophagaceae bacterium]MDW8455708.1 HmuY family protein [Cytophagaceae bacterium]